MSTNPSAKETAVPYRRSSWVTLSIPELTIVLFAFFLSLYLLLLPDIAHQPWDSLDYSYSLEQLGVITMRGNHPLGHVIHFLAFSFAQMLGYDGRVLLIAQIINGFAGSAIVALFFWALAHQLQVKPFVALGSSILLGAGQGFWFYTGTADIYVISLLFILLTWVFLVHEVTWRNRPLPIASGIFAGLSILTHQLNILLIPTGMFLILLASGRWVGLERKTKQVASFLLLAVVTSMIGYVALGFIATSSNSLSRVLGWAQGHFGDPTYGQYLSIDYFVTAFDTASRTIVTDWQNGSAIFRYIFVSILLLATLTGLLFNRSLDDNRRPVWVVSSLQTLITWVLILWWEPQNMKFWILTLVPWMFSLALAFEALDSTFQARRLRLHHSLGLVSRTLPALLGMLVLAANLPVLWKQHNPQSDTTVAFHQAIDLWARHSEPDSVLITAGDLVPHLLYWANRPGTVILYRSLQVSQPYPDEFHDLHTRIEQAQCEHRSVLFTPEAAETITDNELLLVGVSRDSLRTFFNDYAEKGKVVFWYENLFSGRCVPVYELTGEVNCVN